MTKENSSKNESYKNLDNMKLLISYPEFQKRVKEIRTKLHIPDGGIKSYAESEEWRKETAKCDRALQKEPDFVKECREIHTLKDKNEITSFEFEERYKELTKDISYYYFHRSVKKLMDDFNVPLNYELSIDAYIKGGTVNAPRSNFSAILTKERCAPITFYTRLTDEDLREIKQYVNEHFGDQLPFVQNIRNVDQRIEIEKLQNDREERDESSWEYYVLSDEDISERIYGTPDKAKDIYEDVRSLKALRKRRFTPRVSIGQ